MNKVNIYGASGHAKVVVDVLRAMSIEIMGVFDDNKELKHFLNYPVLQPHFNDVLYPTIITIGDNRIRKKVLDLHNINTCSFVAHPTSVISPSACVGPGTVVMPKAVINAEAAIGNHCIVNTACVVEHDVVLENFVHISPNATLAGGVKVGEGTHIGAGAVVLPNIHIGRWATVGAGAVVTKDIPDNTKVVGIPAKPLNH